MQTSDSTPEPSAGAGAAPVDGAALYSAANYDPAQSLGRLLRKVLNSISRDIDAQSIEGAARSRVEQATNCRNPDAFRVGERQEGLTD